MSFSPDLKYMAMLFLGGGKVETFRRVTELAALRNAKNRFTDGVPDVARLVLRPVDGRGVLLDGFIEYRRKAGRWSLFQENLLDKAA